MISVAVVFIRSVLQMQR